MMDFFQAGTYIKQAEGNKANRPEWQGTGTNFVYWDFENQRMKCSTDSGDRFWEPGEKDLWAVNYEEVI